MTDKSNSYISKWIDRILGTLCQWWSYLKNSKMILIHKTRVCSTESTHRHLTFASVLGRIKKNCFQPTWLYFPIFFFPSKNRQIVKDERKIYYKYYYRNSDSTKLFSTACLSKYFIRRKNTFMNGKQFFHLLLNSKESKGFHGIIV
jgi:hypothetical protein